LPIAVFMQSVDLTIPNLTKGVETIQNFQFYVSSVTLPGIELAITSVEIICWCLSMLEHSRTKLCSVQL